MDDFSKTLGNNPTERALDEADRQAESTDIRLMHEEVFSALRKSSRK